MTTKKTIEPGLHPYIILDHFSTVERSIIDKLSKEWYVTNGGGILTLGSTSSYGYCLIKPTDKFQKMFNLNREIVVVFSSYPDFEPRTLDVFDSVFEKYEALRLDNICTVLISRDIHISTKLSNLLKSDPESRIIIPFHYEELLTNMDPYFLENRFRNKFYNRDLFAFQAPIKNEFFFFGRNDLVHEIVNRHRSNENSGLFGLRKTGKTSVIFSINRTLQKLKESSVFIDCQNPSFHKKRWNRALHYVITQLKEQNNISIEISPSDLYTEESASEYFEKDILALYRKNQKKSFLLIFDEIENITKDISPSSHWTNDMDFVLFWQTLRSLFQKFILTNTRTVFTFLIVGTNPKCIEVPTIHNSDNPIFKKIPYQYIKGFDVPHTREMVKILGGYMGLLFDEIIYAKLTEEFGGHPFLIRHLCSIINKIAIGNRPIRVDKAIYEQAKERFKRENSTYIEMVLNVLKDSYPEEYEMLIYLATNNMESFLNLANEFPELVSHLLGYNIVDYNNGNYNFSIEAVKEYLVKQHKYKKIFTTDEEKWKEISERRNLLERNLRLLVRRQLQAVMGKADAKNFVLDILGNPRKSKCISIGYNEIFDGASVDLYFMDLIKIINKRYDIFKNVFGANQADIIRKLEAVNERRADAHANTLSEDEMNYFRVCISNIESKIEDFM